MTRRAAMWATLALTIGGGFTPSALAQSTQPTRSPTVLLLFLAAEASPRGCPPCVDDDALARLRDVPGVSIGILSATEGVYRSEQFLLDVSAGDRVEYASYRPSYPPPVQLQAAAAGATLTNWSAVLARARAAPQLISPGLLAGSVPGGAAYGGVVGQATTDAIVAADTRGDVEAWSRGSAQTLPSRVEALLARYALVVADLPGGAQGTAELHALVRYRLRSELVVVVERAPDRQDALLWVAVAGDVAGGPRTLTSATTNQRGLVAAVDLPVTVLTHLGVRIPADMRGAVMRPDGPLHAGALRALRARLLTVTGRRMPTLWWLALATTAIMLLGVALGQRRPMARVSGLAWMWLPTAALLPAAFAPSRPLEIGVIVSASLVLGGVSDVLLPWPRAPLLPAVVGVTALTVDALAGTQLFIRSILGPDPAFGARFYGIGNELKSGLAVLAFGAVAATLSSGARARTRVLAMAAVTLTLAVIEGSARIGAGVGGVLLVCAGGAVAVAALLPGRFDRRRLALIAAAPPAGLLLLAVLDLAFAHGTGHFTGSLLHARSAGDLRDLIVRHYTDAWDASKDGLMPEAGGVALIALAIGVYRRNWLLAPLAVRDEDAVPLWRAALTGGLVAGAVGAVVEDSGAVLFVVAIIGLGALLTYIRGAPGDDNSRSTHMRSDLVMIPSA